MPFDRANADHKVVSDFLVGESSGDQCQDFDFPRGEFCEQVAPVWFSVAELFDQPRCYPGMQGGFSIGSPLNGFDQFRCFDILEQI